MKRDALLALGLVLIAPVLILGIFTERLMGRKNTRLERWLEEEE